MLCPSKETILFADDDENDHFFVARTLRQLPFSVEMRFVENGRQAVEYLCGEGAFADRSRFPVPTVMFLDINMPLMDGFAVLEWVKGHVIFKALPVVMVSSSGVQEDIDRAYGLGASAYIVKPGRLDEFERLFKVTGEFFLECAEKPSFADSEQE